MVCSGMSEAMNHDCVAATKELIFYAAKGLFIDDEPASEERLGTEPDVSRYFHYRTRVLDKKAYFVSGQPLTT